MQRRRRILVTLIIVLLGFSGVSAYQASNRFSQPREVALATAEPLFELVRQSPFGNYLLTVSAPSDWAQLEGLTKPVRLNAIATCRDFLALAKQLEATVVDNNPAWPRAHRDAQAQITCVQHLTTTIPTGGYSIDTSFSAAGNFRHESSLIPYAMSVTSISLESPCTRCTVQQFALTTDQEVVPKATWAASFASRDSSDQTVRKLLDAVGTARLNASSSDPNSKKLLDQAVSSVALPTGTSVSIASDPSSGLSGLDLTVPMSVKVCLNTPSLEDPCHICVALTPFVSANFGVDDPGNGYEPREIAAEKFGKDPAFGTIVARPCSAAFPKASS